MRKVAYPKDNDKRIALELEYWKIFENCNLQVEWTRLRQTLVDWSDSIDKETIYPVQINDVVCGRYEKLVDIYLDYKAIKNKKNDDTDFGRLETELFSLFSYNQEKVVFSAVDSRVLYATLSRIGFTCVSLL